MNECRTESALDRLGGGEMKDEHLYHFYNITPNCFKICINQYPIIPAKDTISNAQHQFTDVKHDNY